MTKKYIHYYDSRVYALCYRSINTIYYNFDFCHSVAIIIMKNKQNILKESIVK